MRRRKFIAGLLATAAASRAPAAQPKTYCIAFVTPSQSVSESSLLNELRRLGYAEGNNLVFLRFSANGDATKFDSLVRDVMNASPDVIIAYSSRIALLLKKHSSTIPVVAAMADPVAWGVVPSIAHPGGNITGVSSDAGLEVWGKRLAMLLEVVPKASHIGFLASEYVWRIDPSIKNGVLAAARQLSISLVGSPLRAVLNEPEYDRVFQTMKQEQATGLVVSDQPEHASQQQVIVELAERYRLPTIYPRREFVEVGGLMAYAFDAQDIILHIASYTDLILKGANPGDLPVYQSDKFATIINLKAAKTLGLTVPVTLLASADEVVE